MAAGFQFGACRRYECPSPSTRPISVSADDPAADTPEPQRRLVALAAVPARALVPLVLRFGQHVVPERRVRLERRHRAPRSSCSRPTRRPPPCRRADCRPRSARAPSRAPPSWPLGRPSASPRSRFRSARLAGSVGIDRLRLQLLRPSAAACAGADLGELRQESQRVHQRGVDLVGRLDAFRADVLDRSVDVEEQAPVDRPLLAGTRRTRSGRARWTPAKMKNRPSRPRSISSGVALSGSSPPFSRVFSR